MTSRRNTQLVTCCFKTVEITVRVIQEIDGKEKRTQCKTTLLIYPPKICVNTLFYLGRIIPYFLEHSISHSSLACAPLSVHHFVIIWYVTASYCFVINPLVLTSRVSTLIWLNNGDFSHICPFMDI